VNTPGEPTNWANNLANIFLAPFGIGSSDSSVSAEGTKGDLLQQTQKRLPQSLPIYVACRDNRYVQDECIGATWPPKTGSFTASKHQECIHVHEGPSSPIHSHCWAAAEACLQMLSLLPQALAACRRLLCHS
jgi:hypothetical protein